MSTTTLFHRVLYTTAPSKLGCLIVQLAYEVYPDRVPRQAGVPMHYTLL